ncbi:hypothetical protein [Kallotenue papyrolyticum]|uniref:hypothetical protein n=1 Tax=Kallotenue papyrolyticum TaxID=1325125 RepID=UPI00047854B2|nr:hypothetical protein [Kallotenue papyrolyticum]
MSTLQASYCDQGQALLDQALPEAELARLIAAHLAACAECRQAEAVFQTLAMALRAASAPALPAAVEARLLSRLCSAD